MKKNRGLILSLIISLFVICTIFAIKKIFPFGSFVLNVETLDSTYVPVYYRLWDILHGTSDLFFNWNINGSDLSYLLSHGVMSPVTWIIALFPRDMILNGISYMIIIKVLLITLTTYISINSLFNKAKDIYKVLFTIMYTFSNTLFFSISNLAVLDMMMLIPLLILGYYKLFKENKKILYVIVLSITLMINYTNYFMLLILLVGMTILGSIFLIKEDRLKNIFRIFLYTFISYGIASIVLIPILNLYYQSYFFELNFMMETFDLEKVMTRFVYISPCVIPLILVIKQLFVKKDKNINYYILSMILFLGVGIFLEPISLIWHNGIYLNTFFEYSYIVIFLLIIGALYYLVYNYNNKKNNESLILVSAFAIVLLYLFFIYLFKDDLISSSIVYGVKKNTQLAAYIFLFIISIFAGILIFKNNKKNMSVLMILFTFIQIYVFSYLIINNSIFQNSSIYTNNIKNTFDLKKDSYNYVDLSNKLNIGYPYILDVPGIEMSGLNATVSDVELKNIFKYGGRDYEISSFGGNLFSHALLHNKYYISSKEMDSDLYTLIDSKNGKYYYESKYNLDLIIPYSGKIYDLDYGSIIDNNNGIYKTLFDKEEDIFIKVDVVDDGDNYIFKVKPDKIYYTSFVPELYSNAHIDLSSFEVESQGMYSTDSSIMFVFSSEKEQNIIINKESNGLTDIEIGYIDKEDYIKFINSFEHTDIKEEQEKEKRIYDYEAINDGNILLPIRYSDGLVVKVNGNEVDSKVNVFDLTSIYVNKGHNKIEISYKLKYANIGIIVSIVSLIGFIVIIIVGKVKKDL